MIKSTSLFTLLALAACDSPAPLAAAQQISPAAPAAVLPMPADPPALRASIPTNAWVGRWTGPAGRTLEIANSDGVYSGRYRLTTRDDNGAETSFEALADRVSLVFVRNGETLSLKAATGDQTGVQALAGKQDCLMIAPGEGYCRL